MGDGGDDGGFVAAGGEVPVVFADFVDGDAVAVRAFVAGGPLGEHVREVARLDRRAFVVERKAVGREVVEPDAIGGFAFFENQGGGADAGVGLKHAAGQADDGLQVALGEEHFAEGGGGVGAA